MRSSLVSTHRERTVRSLGSTGLLLCLLTVGALTFGFVSFFDALQSAWARLGWAERAVLWVFPFALVAAVRCVAGARKRRLSYQSGRWPLVNDALRYDRDEAEAASRLDALARAGVGDFASARRLLLRPLAGRLDEERELALCTRVLVAAFEGRPEDALVLCRQLVDVPVEPQSGQQDRRAARRAGVVALARALSGAADEWDYRDLARAALLEPTLFWPCRYGAALACCASGEPDLAQRLVGGAPPWPRDSAFFVLHARILRAGDVRRPLVGEVA